jgi:hypothetical protein
MMNSLRTWLMIVIFLSLAGFPTSASAAGPGPVAESSSPVASTPKQNSSNMIIDPIKPVIIGTHPTIVVHLVTPLGKPIPNQAIRIYVNNVRKAQVLTDSNGVATAVLRYKFTAGTYHIKAVYAGVPILNLAAASAERDLVVEPSEAAIYTVPPIAGISIRFNGKTYVSDQNGRVTIPLKQSGVYPVQVLAVDPKILPSNSRIEFARWGDHIYTAYRETYFPRPNPLAIGFTISYPVKQVFYDSEGRPVNPERISSMTLRRFGETLTFDQAGSLWLASNRVVGRLGGKLESKEILYYFKEIMIDGVNVVNKSQQRFYVQPEQVWPVNLLLYSVQFSGRDAMFHFPIGAGVQLTYPDGRIQEFPFGSDDEIYIPALARGTYLAKVTGALGSTPSAPIHLSRDQQVELLVLSYADMAIIFGLPALVALAFLFIGRPHLLGRRQQLPATLKTNAYVK